MELVVFAGVGQVSTHILAGEDSDPAQAFQPGGTRKRS
jgi:hypothetical protein